MSDQTLEILLIGEESVDKGYYKELSENFNLSRLDNAATVLDNAEDLKPALIILDLDSELKNRYECCKVLSAQPAFENTPIVFATENDSIEERIKGYEVGAYGYLQFPLDFNYLKNKINTFISHEESKEALSAEVNNATATALSAMVGNNELGQAIRFVERSYLVNDFQELADAFLSVTTNLGLKVVIYVKSADGNYYFGTNNNVKPIEAELLTKMHDEADRFNDINNRTLIFYSHISILVKNMPLDEPEKYGRIKDLLPAMLGAADARVVSLDTEAALIRQSESVTASYNQVRETLNSVSNDFSENQNISMETMSKMLQDLDHHIPGMGLEDDQEEYLLGRVGQAVDDAQEILDNSEKLGHSFDMISMLLTHLSTQQENILKLVQTKKEEHTENASSEEIEFF